MGPQPVLAALNALFTAAALLGYFDSCSPGTNLIGGIVSSLPVGIDLLRVPENERSLLTEALRGAQLDDQPLRVLEAGCGKRWLLRPDGVALHITGVDTDAAALRIRREQQHDLDSEIVGDLRSVPLPEAAFDVVYCSYVLEHVAGAEQVLDRFVPALRPGGRLIVRVPDGESVYGFLTKHSPHRVHVLYKRYVERKPNAGKPGYAPYPTVYDPVVSVRGLRSWAAAHQLEVVEEYATNFYLRVFGPFERFVALGLRLIARLSGGRLSATHNNIGFVLVKPPAAGG